MIVFTLFAISITSVAAWTTIAVNGDTIVNSVRHPRKTIRTVKEKVKKAVNGKDK